MTTPPGNGGTGPHGGPAFRIPTAPDVPYGMGRNVNHDPQSRLYPYRSARRARRAVRHRTRTPQLDQNGWGACTFFALLRVLGSDPFYPALQAAGKLDLLASRYPFTDAGGFSGYRDATEVDPFPGEFTYPPGGGEDTGSDGTTCAKLVRDLGVIPGWRTSFTLDDALDALQDYPLYFGSVWTYGMFEPDAQGRIAPTGGEAGGHQYTIDEFIPAGQRPEDYDWVLSDTEDFVGMGNNWNGWGVGGRAFLSVLHFNWLRAYSGDVIVLTPPTAPAPAPEPVTRSKATAEDRKLRPVVESYAKRSGWFGVAQRKVLSAWLQDTDWS
jgi:hypothetical protein